ncbi:hypothetical protein BTS2_1855 [Bacillus sp. TS-2]|nr:hypothetical protein BTS2_1855 [Bacillus sp. TS-2]
MIRSIHFIKTRYFTFDKYRDLDQNDNRSFITLIKYEENELLANLYEINL